MFLDFPAADAAESTTPQPPPPPSTIRPQSSVRDLTHVIAVWNRDYRDEDTVRAVEKALRGGGVGLRGNMTYKPDIFSACGVYRNNEWGLRPALYSSKCAVS